IRPTAARATRAMYFSRFHIMARTTPSVKEIVRPDTPAPVGDSPARRPFAARTVTRSHSELIAGVAVAATNPARTAGDTPGRARHFCRRPRAHANRVRTVPFGQPRRWAASVVVRPAQ